MKIHQIYLAPSQRYFGTCVVVLKRRCENLKELKIAEYNHKIEFKGLKFDDPDFGHISRPIERKIPEKIMKKLRDEIKKYL